MNKSISLIWEDIFRSISLNKNAVLVEVAPGYKTKIGSALANLGFRGTIYLIESNELVAASVLENYKELLPHARIIPVVKCLGTVSIGKDIPSKADAIVANHPLDDMALQLSIPAESAKRFFMLDSGPDRIRQTQELWENITHATLSSSIKQTTENWIRFINRAKPRTVIISQCEGTTLQSHKIYKPDETGKQILDALKNHFDVEIDEPQRSCLDMLGLRDRWLIKRFTIKNLSTEMRKQPEAIERLNPSIFCKEQATKLPRRDYSVVYTNNSLLRGLGYITSEMRQDRIDKIIGNAFAYTLERRPAGNRASKTVYADKQADPTGIALSGNYGSGRACYIGSEFNIKGIGKTALIGKPKDPIHATGKLDIVTALREAVMTQYVCEHMQNGSSPVLAVIALKERIHVPWEDASLAAALLVRLDRGTLDRPSHLAFTKLKRGIDFPELIKKYARLDAEMFGQKILHGAWSTGNVSLDGHLLDMESVSITRGRGPRCNITKKYLSNYFGYESIGFKQIIEQLADMLQADSGKCRTIYDEERARHMQTVLLQLLGVPAGKIQTAIEAFPNVGSIAKRFEELAKKASPRKADQNVFGNKDDGTHLLDFSALFMKMPHLTFEHVVRKTELAYCETEIYQPANPAEQYLKTHAIIERAQKSLFLRETERLLEDITKLVSDLRTESYLPTATAWRKQIKAVNKNRPSFSLLTEIIAREVKLFEEGRISNGELNRRVNAIEKSLR